MARLSPGTALLSLVLGLGSGGCLRTQQAAVSPARPVKPLAEREFAPVVLSDEPAATFVLDGRPMCFAGGNNYYLTWKSRVMIDSALKNAQKMGLTVMRQWGHLDMGSLDGTVPHLKADGKKEGVYFQYWDTSNNRPAYNDGPDGLQRLDYLLQQAQKYQLRLVLTLTNNWPDFGGMDQYLLWYGLKKHHEFYTDPRVKQAYKDWATHLLSRVNSLTGVPYKDDPTIFAWQLANEPRIRNYTKTDSHEGWDRQTITKWAEEMAGHIRSLDPNHLISVGDEGGFWDGSKPFYDGADGTDHRGLLAIEDIDYATFHLYPELWSTGLYWADGWIEDHLIAAREAWKPAVLEEYGVIVKRDEAGQVTYGWDRRQKAYHQWNKRMMQRGGAGIMYWMQAGFDDTTRADYKDFDGFTIYDPDTDPSAKLLQQYTTAFPKEAQACQLAGNQTLIAKRQVPAGFVTTSAPPGQARALALLNHNGWQVAD